MTISNQRLGAAGSHKPAGTAPLRTPVEPPAASPAAPAPKAAQAGAPKATVALPDGPIGAIPVIDMGAIARQSILNMAPGAKFTGTWSDAQLRELQATLEAVPPALRDRFKGTEFAMEARPKGLPGEAYAYATNSPRRVAFDPRAVSLPGATPGVSGFQEAAMHELAHLVDHDPMHSQEFAKLSGWKEIYTSEKKALGGLYHKKEVLLEQDANGIGMRGTYAEGSQTEYHKKFSEIKDATVQNNVFVKLLGQFGSYKVDLAYKHDPSAQFVSDEAKTDPRDDYAESFRTYTFRPEVLLKTSPEKFLFINAEAKAFTPDQVKQMAANAGVDLGAAMARTVASGRAYQPTVDRILDQHGLSLDATRLAAADQATLNRLSNLDQLKSRLSATMVYQKPASEATIAKAKAMAAQIAAMPAEPAEARVARRQEFLALPLEAQLKADPKLALGNAWHQYGPEAQAQLTDPKALGQLIDGARARSGGMKLTNYPQGFLGKLFGKNDAAKESAYDAVMTTMFDPGAKGQAVRQALAGLNPAAGAAGGQKLQAALEQAGVWQGLPKEQQAYFKDAKNWQALSTMAKDPDLADALAVLRTGAVGADRLKAALDMRQAGQSQAAKSVVDAFKWTLDGLKAERKAMAEEAGGSMLGTAMAAINRQSQAGNQDFLKQFAASPEQALGPWVWKALSPAEQALFKDSSYRDALVQKAGLGRATGASLAQEAQMFRMHSGAIQKLLGSLLDGGPQGAALRLALQHPNFTKDPVKTFQDHSVWDGLPPVMQRFVSWEEKQKYNLPRIQEAAKVIDGAVRSATPQQRANLASYVRAVDASNYEGMLFTLGLPADEARPRLEEELNRAKDTGAMAIQGGNGGG